jgi:hypothetical protein
VTDPRELLEFLVDDGELPRGIPMVAGLTGFMDSGSAVSQFTEYLMGALESKVVVEFDVDSLLDYRARRPTMYFDQDHFTGYESPRLNIRLMRDDLDQPFYLLTGFEPDYRWEAFSAALRSFIDEFEVSDFVWVHAIPMPAPHSRPIGVTVSGNRHDLIESLSVWRPNTQVPGNALHMVEYHLQQAGNSVVGFVVLVPHYLAESEYPTAALVSLQSITAATGLIFPTDRLRDEGRVFDAKIREQVESNDELAGLVEKLENTYDMYMKEQKIRSPFMDAEGDLPTADHIAAELEGFLAMQRRRDDDIV